MNMKERRDVFISYSSVDEKLADSLCQFLELKGISCWFAKRDIPVGDTYPADITKAIKGVTVAVIIISKDSMASEHVGNEVGLAFKYRKNIIPIRIDDTELDESLDYYLNRKNWILASANPERHFTAISNAILRLLPVSDSKDKEPLAKKKMPSTSTGKDNPTKPLSMGGKLVDGTGKQITVTPVDEEFNGSIVKLSEEMRIDVVRVEPGTFTMAHEDGENKGNEIAHQVTLTKHFWIGKTTLTQDQWNTIVPPAPDTEIMGGNYPMVGIDWWQAQAFLGLLNEKYAGKLPAGYQFDLPTEAQWEYAAQGGHKRVLYTKYAGANYPGCIGWYEGNSRNKFHPVARKTPNELGLYDMCGNVEEWCKDCCDYIFGVKTNTCETDAVDPLCLEGKCHVLRGGNYSSPSKECRIAYRGNIDLPHRYSCIGFRIAVVPITDEGKSKNGKY